MQNIMGEENLKNKIVEYYNHNKFTSPMPADFRSIVLSDESQINSGVYDEIFSSDKAFDYAIKNITKRENNLYDVTVARIEEGVMPIQLNVYTENDTIKYFWSGKERYKIFTIKSETEILSAELDYSNKNILDLNFANNSYVIDSQYWGSISYATRVFFWFQNALMLIGGKG